jgi:hypothetical protein
MSFVKISELPQNSVLSQDDLLAMVHSTAGTLVTYKVGLSDLDSRYVQLFVPLSGGIMNSSLNVLGSISARDNLFAAGMLVGSLSTTTFNVFSLTASNLSANNVFIGVLSGSNAGFINLSAFSLNVFSLSAINERVNSLTANYINTTSLTAYNLSATNIRGASGVFDTATITSISAASLVVVNATVGTLSATNITSSGGNFSTTNANVIDLSAYHLSANQIVNSQIWTDPVANTVGINTKAPNNALTVIGTISAVGAVTYTAPRPNLVYVATWGDDTNVGTNPSAPFKTIKKACQFVSQNQGMTYPVTQTAGQPVTQYTIFVMTGTYTEQNPIYVPQSTSIIGDGLRRVTIIPANLYYDVLWVNNACYVWGITFRSHLEPSAAIAFPNLDSTKPQFQIAFNTSGYAISAVGTNDYYRTYKPLITTSPYPQGCSSITQSVSAPNQFTVAQTISGRPSFFNTASSRVATEFTTFINVVLGGQTAVPATFPTYPANIPVTAGTAITILTANRSAIQAYSSAYWTANYPGVLTTPQLTASTRDMGAFVDTIVADLKTGSNHRAVEFGDIFYVGTINQSGSGNNIPLPAGVVGPCNGVFGATYNYINAGSGLNLSAYADSTTFILSEFKALTGILTNGQNSVVLFPTLTPTTDELAAANLLSANRSFFQAELTAYVDNNFPGFNYTKSTAATISAAKARAYRDAGWIVDAIAYDLQKGTNSRAVTYANSYYYPGYSRIAGQEIATAKTLGYLSYLASYVINNSAAQTTYGGCGLRIDGSLCRGPLRSFVTDSFTQVNEGGLGMHILNNGYAQLVSTFTVGCRIGLLAESGGQMTVNTSNCTFGLSGLVANGYSSTPVLSGILSADAAYNSIYITVSGVLPRYDAPDYLTYPMPVTVPYVGLVMTVDGDTSNTLYIVASASLVDAARYSYNLTFNQNVQAPLKSLSAVKFYVRSEIATNSHAFEYVGSGTQLSQLSQAIPALGGVANPDNEAIALSGGAVFFTSTNTQGNFKVGNNFTILQDTGTIQGTTFQRSILALVTPLTLALE